MSKDEMLRRIRHTDSYWVFKEMQKEIDELKSRVEKLESVKPVKTRSRTKGDE